MTWPSVRQRGGKVKGRAAPQTSPQRKQGPALACAAGWLLLVTIPLPPHGADTCRGVTELLAQAGDVHVDGACLDDRAGHHQRDQFAPRENAARLSAQRVPQAALGGRQRRVKKRGIL